jgi:hypothetical protein
MEEPKLHGISLVGLFRLCRTLSCHEYSLMGQDSFWDVQRERSGLLSKSLEDFS